MDALSRCCKGPFIFFVSYVSKIPYGKRKEENDGMLQITAIIRAICTSDDARTQAHAVSNILGIAESDLLCQLTTNEELFTRISELCIGSYDRTLQLCGRGRADLAASTSWLYRAAITHISLLTTNYVLVGRWTLAMGELDESAMFISPDQLQHAPPNIIAAWLGYMLDPDHGYNPQARHLALHFIMDGRVNPSWRCISMVIAVIIVEWDVCTAGSRDALHAAYTGKSSTVLRNLKLLVKKSNDPDCKDRATLRKYLFEIFRFARKAAADMSRASGDAPIVIANLLGYCEAVIRAKSLPSDLVSLGRAVRKESFGALELEFKKLSGKGKEHTPTEALHELIQLFTELEAILNPPAPDTDSNEEETVYVLRYRYLYAATVGGRRTSTLSEEDEELVFLFSPIVQQLNAIMTRRAADKQPYLNRNWDYSGFEWQVTELEAIFTSFEAAVNCRSRQIKRRSRSRNPDLQWCYHE
ncbi:hypothetical protein FS837_007266 [Tulasnella sp. UAMH 9824]|nr:hypothetical protein FS837_007266 [Tulasnella sp. UAMH 9824]